jgi:hypothetical protein
LNKSYIKDNNYKDSNRILDSVFPDINANRLSRNLNKSAEKNFNSKTSSLTDEKKLFYMKFIKKSRPNKYNLEISGCSSFAHLTDSDCSSSLVDSKIIERSKLRIIRENEMSIHKSRKNSPNSDHSINEHDIFSLKNKLNQQLNTKSVNKIASYNDSIINKVTDINEGKRKKNDINTFKSIEEIHLNLVKTISNSKRMISILEGNIVIDSFQTVVNFDEIDL